MKVEWFYVNEDVQIQVDEEALKTINSVGDLFDELDDLITVDEINPRSGEHWLENSGNLFSFTLSDYESLERTGICRAYYIGKLADNVDMNVESDREFMKWYNGQNK